MIVQYFKSWIRENENKIDNLFLHSFKCPMKITEMYKDIDANGTGQNYQNLTDLSKTIFFKFRQVYLILTHLSKL